MENKRKIFFRADAGAQIGYGHFIRTLALADMLREDFDCTFFTQSPSEYQQKEAEKVCPLIALSSDDSKFDKFLEYLTGDEIVVLDNYFFTSEYQKRIKDKGCKLVCIDDMHDKHYYADVIINQGLGYTEADYSCENYTKFAFGLNYSLLRKPFLQASEKATRKIHNTAITVLVAFGGSDYFDLTSRVINQIAEIRNVASIIAIVGDSYRSGRRISHPKVTYKQNLSAWDLADLFLAADYAILPASTMMNEALACGTTVIGGYYVDNQEHDYYMFLQEGLILGVGDYTDDGSMVRIVDNLSKHLKRREIAFTSDVPSHIINLFKIL